MDAAQKQTKLQLLRQIPGVTSASDVSNHTPFSRVENGMPRGALIEIGGCPGSGKTELVLQFLAENPKLRVAWIEKEFSIYPCAFAEHEIDLGRLLFVDPGPKTAMWCAHQILKSQLFEVITITEEEGARSDENSLRRLQLLAQKSQSTIFLLNSEARTEKHWPISMQLEVKRSPKGLAQIETLKRKLR